MRNYRIHNAGDGALVIEFGDRIDPVVNQSVLDLSNRLDAMTIAGIVETVPTFRSLMVHYDPLVLPAEQLIATIESIVHYGSTSVHAGTTWSLPVCYDSRIAEDFEYLSKRFGISGNCLIEIHSSRVYSVYMLGFLPGQPYLGDLADELRIPRRNNPRMKIPAGSVGIATSLTCIYPSETPCGWHIIGRTPINLWNQKADSRPLLSPGDRIAFEPVSILRFEELTAIGGGGLQALSPRTEEAMA